MVIVIFLVWNIFLFVLCKNDILDRCRLKMFSHSQNSGQFNINKIETEN